MAGAASGRVGPVRVGSTAPASRRAGGASAHHAEWLYRDGLIHCDSSEYTIGSGTIAVVLHSNDDFATGHQVLTPHHVRVQRNDAQGDPVGASYRLVGSETHGIQPSASTGGPAVLDTFKYRILGTGDSVNIEVHSDGSGGYYVVDRGTCEPAEG